MESFPGYLGFTREESYKLANKPALQTAGLPFHLKAYGWRLWWGGVDSGEEGKRTEVIRYQKKCEPNKLVSLGDADVTENQLASLKKVYQGWSVRPETGINEVLTKQGKGGK